MFASLFRWNYLGGLKNSKIDSVLFQYCCYFSDGTVWTAGGGSAGRLGHHGTQNVPVFHPVEGLPSVQMINVAMSCCVVLTLDGQVVSYHACVCCSWFAVHCCALIPRGFIQIDQHHGTGREANMCHSILETWFWQNESHETGVNN